jgi:uncharacterized membrane protein YphA (DoxX/SURF4 family)
VLVLLSSRLFSRQKRITKNFLWRVLMFYRVDYLLAVIVAGFVIGASLGRWTSRIESQQLARWYFIVVASILAVSAILTVRGIVLTNGPVLSKISGATGDIGCFILGALFGTAIRRSDRLELLREPRVFYTMCLSVGYGFVISGYIKAFYLESMTQFFTQSGYSVPFLKFIMTIEVLGGIGLLIPVAMPFALAGLTIDMFGAIATHVHNGDPLNDSTGAIITLLKFAAIATLWALHRSSVVPTRSTRKALFGAGAVAILCLVSAVGGSAMMRHPASSSVTAH